MLNEQREDFADRYVKSAYGIIKKSCDYLFARAWNEHGLVYPRGSSKDVSFEEKLNVHLQPVVKMALQDLAEAGKTAQFYLDKMKEQGF